MGVAGGLMLGNLQTGMFAGDETMAAKLRPEDTQMDDSEGGDDDDD
ncbi:hypothetical protein [Mesorhizobium sp. NPDC059025]